MARKRIYWFIQYLKFHYYLFAEGKYGCSGGYRIRTLCDEATLPNDTLERTGKSVVANHNFGLRIHNLREIATMVAMKRKYKFRRPAHWAYRRQRSAAACDAVCQESLVTRWRCGDAGARSAPSPQDESGTDAKTAR